MKLGIIGLTFLAVTALGGLPSYDAQIVYTSVPDATSYRAGIDGVLWTVKLPAAGSLQTNTLSHIPYGDHIIYVEGCGTNWVSERGTTTYSLTATNSTSPGVKLIQLIPSP